MHSTLEDFGILDFPGRDRKFRLEVQNESAPGLVRVTRPETRIEHGIFLTEEVEVRLKISREILKIA